MPFSEEYGAFNTSIKNLKNPSFPPYHILPVLGVHSSRQEGCPAIFHFSTEYPQHMLYDEMRKKNVNK